MPLNSQIIFRSKWFFTLLIAVIFITGSILTAYVYAYVNETNLNSLSRGTQTIAASIDESEVSILQANETDLINPNYLKLKSKLQNILIAEPDVRFVYIIGRNEAGQFFFYTDSENPSSADYSPPGQIYEEADQSFNDAFESAKPNITGPTADRWGTWITALAPIKDPVTGKVVAVVGMDIDARSHQNHVLVNTAIPGIITILLLILAFIGQRISKHEQEMVELKSEFVSIASHELRSPLNGITWALDNIANAPNLTAPQSNMLSEVKATTNNLMGNINDILNASAITGAKQTKLLLEPVDIGNLLKSVAEQHLLAAKERHVEISMEKFPVGSHVIKVDKEKIKRVFSNILSNSIKYSKPDTTVEVSFSQVGDAYHIQFTDHGIGIPQSEQGKIFSGYYRAQNAMKTGVTGTGLGLYFAQKIVELHGGKVWLKSEENRGTTVYVQIPFTKN